MSINKTLVTIYKESIEELNWRSQGDAPLRGSLRDRETKLAIDESSYRSQGDDRENQLAIVKPVSNLGQDSCKGSGN